MMSAEQDIYVILCRFVVVQYARLQWNLIFCCVRWSTCVYLVSGNKIRLCMCVYMYAFILYRVINANVTYSPNIMQIQNTYTTQQNSYAYFTRYASHEIPL